MRRVASSVKPVTTQEKFLKISQMENPKSPNLFVNIFNLFFTKLASAIGFSRDSLIEESADTILCHIEQNYPKATGKKNELYRTNDFRLIKDTNGSIVLEKITKNLSFFQPRELELKSNQQNNENKVVIFECADALALLKDYRHQFYKRLAREEDENRYYRQQQSDRELNLGHHNNLFF